MTTHASAQNWMGDRKTISKVGLTQVTAGRQA